MIASTHLTVGAAVGILSYRFIFKAEVIYGVPGALILGVISHLILDMIPHGDDELYRPGGAGHLILLVELIFVFLAIYWCGVDGFNLGDQNDYLLAGMIGGALPDVPHVLMGLLKIDWPILRVADQFNSFFHTSWHAGSFWQGLLPQIVILVLSLVILYYFKSGVIKTIP